MITIALLTLFLAAYASGPAGLEDLAARARRLAFPQARVLALKGSL